MRYLALVLVLSGFAAAAPARAFEIQGENATLEDGASQFAAPASPIFKPDFSEGSSLAMPYIGKTDSQLISDYGNGISIPGPGIDKPAPAWALPR
jgi:hypothetical protein